MTERPASQTPDAEKLWAVLCHCVGEKHAMTAAQLAAQAALGDDKGKHVQAVISEAAEFFPRPVGATTEGFFVIENAEEATHIRQTFRSRLDELARRIAILDDKVESCLGLRWDSLAQKYVVSPGLFKP